MAIFTSPEVRFESEERWIAERLGTAQRAEKELKTVIDWRMASDARPSWKDIQRHGEDVREYWSQ